MLNITEVKLYQICNEHGFFCPNSDLVKQIMAALLAKTVLLLESHILQVLMRSQLCSE
jgi:vesicle coat complex subunit